MNKNNKCNKNNSSVITLMLNHRFTWRSTQYLGKFVRYGSEEVILQLINYKCLPCSSYAIEACPVNKTGEKSVEFTTNRVLMKIFQIKSINTIRQCRWYFGIANTKLRIAKHKSIF